VVVRNAGIGAYGSFAEFSRPLSLSQLKQGHREQVKRIRVPRIALEYRLIEVRGFGVLSLLE
jgi:hypothetical protein